MKKRFISILVVMVVIIAAITLISCTDYTKDDPQEESKSTPTYTHTITNGTFYDAKNTSTSTSGDKNILDSISSWSQSSGSLTTSATGSSGVMAAVIDMSEQSKYDEIKNTYLTIKTDEEGNMLEEKDYVSIAYPGLDSKHIPKQYAVDEDGKKIKNDDGSYKMQDEDSNVLVLASTDTAGSHFVKNSSAYTLTKGKTYLLQFSVNSKMFTAGKYNNSGAYFIVKGDIEYMIPNIDTNGQWETYYLYIESNKNADLSINVELWLGFGPGITTSTTYQDDGADIYSVRGIALFDNIICEPVDIAEDLTIINDDVTKYEVKVDGYNKDAEFSYAANRFANFKANLKSKADDNGFKYVDALSVYYLEGADLSNRTHVTSYTTNTYRKYFYSFRENYTSNNLSKYELKSSESSLNTRYYGNVDLSKLYTIPSEAVEDTSEIKDNYATLAGSSYNINMMSYDDWYNKVMLYDADEKSGLTSPYSLMILNTDLQANTLETKESIVIEANSYYLVSLKAYVWAKEYNGDYKYFANYSGTEPKDPRLNSTWTAYQKYLYNLKDSGALPEEYFAPLTEEEVAASAQFNSDNAGNYKYKATDGNGNDTAEYTTLLNGVKAFIVNNVEGVDDVSKVSASDVENFYYYYAYTTYKDDTTISEDIKTALYNGYLSYRKENISTSTKLTEEVTKYEEDYNKYLSDKEEYDAKYASWLTKNTDPFATIKLNGVGDNLIKNTTKMGEWETISFYVSGSQLTSRKLTLQLSLGTGTDYSTKMIGGVFFNDINIVRYAENEKPEVAFTSISIIDSAEQVKFGDLSADATSDNWDLQLATETATADAQNVSVSLEEDVDTIVIDGVNTNLSTLKLTNGVATATTVEYIGNNILTIKPGTFYRFAFLAKTEDIDESVGISFTLLSGKTVDDITTTLNSAVTAYTNNTNEWAEVVYYIKGDLTDTYYVTLKVEMGTGNRFDTSKYVKGNTYLKAFNLMEIEYDEYSSAKTGDKITKEVTFTSATYGIDSDSIKFSNPHYANLDYANTSTDEFDAVTKQLVGIAKPSNWTLTTPIYNTYNVPTEITLNKAESKLTFKGSTGYTEENGDIKEVKPVKYEVWYRYTGDNNKQVEKLYDVIAATNENENYECAITGVTANTIETHFAVKAIGVDGYSDLSSYTDNYVGENDKTDILVAKTEVKTAKAQAGTIVVANQETPIFGNVDGSEYVSAYPTILKIASPYKVAYGIHSETVSLTSNGYYKISTWVKTEGDTTVSIIVGGTSGSLLAETDDKNLGFISVNTAGKWQEYSFYVTTSNFNTSLYIEFTLGNPNATKKTASNSDNTYYALADLSDGVAYFDAARVTTIDEDEYKEAKKANDEKGTNVRYASIGHKYLYKNSECYVYTMSYNIDSFDAFTTTTSKDLGHSPSNYSRSYETSLSSGTANATYGVYDVSSSNSLMNSAVKYLYSSDKTSTSSDVSYPFNDIFKDLYKADENPLKINDKNIGDWEDDEWDEFMKSFLSINRTNTDGDIEYFGGLNVLAMSNKLNSGYSQYYTLNSTYNPVAKAGKYYVVTFSARTLIAGVTTEKTTAEDGSETTSYKYSLDNAYGEFRLTPSTNSSDNTGTISTKISSHKYGTGEYDYVTYKVYLYNPTDADKTMNWAFYLGNTPVTITDDNKDTVDTDLNQYIVGLMSVDLVSCEEISETVYTNATSSISEDSTISKYEYKKAEEKEPENPDEPEEPEDEDNFWSRLVKNQYFWLYISSFVIAVVIIIVVIVILIRNWKKRHPKARKFENEVKTEKDVKVEQTQPSEKVEVDYDDDEYSDASETVVEKEPKEPKVKKEKKKNYNSNSPAQYKKMHKEKNNK